MGSFVQYTVQGLAAGGFYALSALGLAVIFGVLGVVNFSHGACYMLGAVIAAVLLAELQVGFWVALLVVPILMFGFGVLMERLLVRWLLALDPLYNFLLTFGLTLILVEAVKQRYGVSGLPYEVPAGLGGQVSIGSVNLSAYAVFACLLSVAVCLAGGLRPLPLRLLRPRGPGGRPAPDEGAHRHDRPRLDGGARAHARPRHQRRS